MATKLVGSGCDICKPTYARDVAADTIRDNVATIAALREALTEIRDRLAGNPAYAELTEDEAIDIGGDTAELSYLVGVANLALSE